MKGTELRELVSAAPLLADGAMGTALIARGIVDLDGCVEFVNISEPDAVSDVHREFVDAGSKLVEANTFGANRFNLSAHGLEGRLEEINRRGIEIAKEASSQGRKDADRVVVAGSVGPLRVRLAPYGRVSKAAARDAYAEQIEILVKAGADIIWIETQSDLNEMREALRAARSVSDVAIIVTATFTRDDRTLLGSTPDHVAKRLVDLGADAIGVNCSEGPAQVVRILDAMRTAVGDVPLVAMPNAGGPTRVGERIFYPATPEYFGEYAREFLAAGASIIGGCCGTGPEHIRAMAKALAEPRQLHIDLLGAQPAEGASDEVPAPTELASKLRSGRFVVCVEMDPPRSTAIARLLAGAQTLADAGADTINVGDSPMARMRMSPWAPARLIQEVVGLETVLHFPVRGRNLLRIQGDLLAAHALGIRNLFVVLGDPTRIGDYPAATGNVDVVPTGLVALIRDSFNKGTDQAGSSIGEPTSFFVGCAVNLSPLDLDKECKLLKKKIDSGAEFALSQAVFSADTLRTFRKAYEERHGRLDLSILVGLLPLVTARHAEFLHNELPGVSISEDIRVRMARAGEEEEAEGLAIAVELAREVRAEAAGIYLMPAFSRYDLAAEVVEAVKATASG